MSRVAILIAILVLSVVATGLSGSVRTAPEGIVIAAFSSPALIVVAGGEFPWQGRGH
jgi:hypothetical protein